MYSLEAFDWKCICIVGSVDWGGTFSRGNGVMVIVNGETCVVGRHLTGNGLVLLGRLIGEAFVVVVMVSQ